MYISIQKFLERCSSTTKSAKSWYVNTCLIGLTHFTTARECNNYIIYKFTLKPTYLYKRTKSHNESNDDNSKAIMKLPWLGNGEVVAQPDHDSDSDNAGEYANLPVYTCVCVCEWQQLVACGCCDWNCEVGVVVGVAVTRIFIVVHCWWQWQ